MKLLSGLTFQIARVDIASERWDQPLSPRIVGSA
jgi:hypothetical protein